MLVNNAFLLQYHSYIKVCFSIIISSPFVYNLGVLEKKKLKNSKIRKAHLSQNIVPGIRRLHFDAHAFSFPFCCDHRAIIHIYIYICNF